jgi:Zn-finger nucleic acid-binding protein
MKCPSCEGALAEIDNEGVTLDFCSGCKGIWFDRGEVGEYFELSRDLPDLGEEDREERGYEVLGVG